MRVLAEALRYNNRLRKVNLCGTAGQGQRVVEGEKEEVGAGGGRARMLMEQCYTIEDGQGTRSAMLEHRRWQRRCDTTALCRKLAWKV